MFMYSPEGVASPRRPGDNLEVIIIALNGRVRIRVPEPGAFFCGRSG
jgi:hypothetical protein